MCGIAGIAASHKAGVHRHEIGRMNDRLVHRGPDGEGVYISPDGRAGLGHRRLIVVDTTPAGAEPMCNENGTIWLTFNGEIYNYRALRAELIAVGHHFKSATDAETIVHAYEEYGVACLDRLEGMFAFAIWDENKKELFIARDRFGEKPLSYCLDGGRIVFASELQAVFAGLGRVPVCDETALPYFFSHNHTRSPQTGFAGVFDLPPAHYGIFKNGALKIARYWHFDFSKKTSLSYADAVYEIDRLLERAVRDRMRADVPLGIFLSGGIDSSAIAAYAVRHSPSIRTFSAGFDGFGGDEREQARKTAVFLGANHTEYSLRPVIPELLPHLVRLYGRPYADSSAIALYCLAHEARADVTVALGGDGGDEAFGGYRRYAYWNIMRYFTKDAYEYIASHNYFPTAVPSAPLRSLDEVFAFGVATFLPDDLLVKSDRATMAHGLELRSPFLDRALIEFAASLPATWKIRLFETKRILRDVLRGIVPPHVLVGRKRGFEVPVDTWFRGQWYAWACEVLLDARTTRRAYFERKKIETMLAEHVSGARRHGQRIWLLICFELWNREFIDR